MRNTVIIDVEPDDIRMNENPEIITKIAGEFTDSEGNPIEVFQKKRGWQTPMIVFGEKSLPLVDLYDLWRKSYGYACTFGIRAIEGGGFYLQIQLECYLYSNVQKFLRDLEDFIFQNFGVDFKKY